MELLGRSVVIVGLGASGRSAARFAMGRGARVTCVDANTDVEPVPGATMELGPHRRETLLAADLVVVSPGVPAAQPDLVAAREAGVPMLGELGFAWEFLDLPTVAITGTNGKSTVTHFTGQLLAAAGRRPFVGGNLGRPLTDAIGGDTVGAGASGGGFDALVVEVSSYQLELPGDFAPKVGVILNLTPDHLARHGDMDAYGRVKCRLFERMAPDDLAILPVGDERLIRLAREVGRGTRAWLGAHPGVLRDGRKVAVRIPGVSADLDLGGFAVPGEHNLDNAATAALLALALGADPARVQAALPGLAPLEHRMEVVGEQGGVVWINDSKATNVDATRVGVSGMDRPCVVLLGGQAKGPGFAELSPLLARHRAVVTFGGSGPDIADELAAAGLCAVRVGSLDDAVDAAATLARPGDAVLLSPGCASFDAFSNFEHRGRHFREIVRRRMP